MKTPTYAVLLIVAVAFTPFRSQGEEAQTNAPDLIVTAGDVTDTRSTGQLQSGCEVELRFTGDAVADTTTIRQVRLRAAVDDLGRDLKPDKEREGYRDQYTTYSGTSSSRESILRKKVSLRNPSRKARIIRVLEGEAEIMRPTTANGGIVNVTDFVKRPGEMIEAEALKKNNVQVIYLTKESYESKKKEFEENKKSSVTDQENKTRDVYTELFNLNYGGTFFREKNTIVIFIHDPDNRLADMTFLDSTGKAIQPRLRSTGGKMRTFGFEYPLPVDAQLTFYLATPEAITRIPFKVENIALP